MQVALTARNFEMTPALRRYAETKVARLRKFVNRISSAHVILSLEKHRQIAEVTLRVRDLTIRGEESSDDLYSAIDLVVDKIERQIVRYKERILRHAGRAPDRPRLKRKASSEVPEAHAEDGPPIVRTKRFAIKPLSLDEAALQMDLLGHNFFVFRNASTQEVNVLYRRQDGKYGLIEPEG
jgi:putative sigma-54 modulation protein